MIDMNIDYRPKPWTPKAIPTIWVDQTSDRASPRTARRSRRSSATAQAVSCGSPGHPPPGTVRTASCSRARPAGHPALAVRADAAEEAGPWINNSRLAVEHERRTGWGEVAAQDGSGTTLLLGRLFGARGHWGFCRQILPRAGQRTYR